MALNHDLVGTESQPIEWSWTSTDALLYALGVGAGLDDPSRELEFTTENTKEMRQKVLPTFGVLLTRAAPRPSLGDYNPAKLVHAEQAITPHQPLPVAGTAHVTATVTGIYDKGSGALAVTKATATDASTGQRLVTTRSSAFIRGEGGFGGDRGTSSPWSRPQTPADHVVAYQTRPEQALLYRLTGDRNPLHSGPTFATHAGFDRPILHGLCTYGVPGRALLHTLCNGEPERVLFMEGRFCAPVPPGETLTVSMWVDGDTASFQTTRSDGTVAIDRGIFRFLPPPSTCRHDTR